MKSGSCHCGAIRFSVEGEPTQVIECNCSHCSRKGLLLWFVTWPALAVTSGGEQLSTYTFNKHVIQHQFCAVCGCQPFGLGCKPDGTEMAAINIRCLEDIDLGAIKRKPVDGRSL